jgi:uncharacterized membrane protein
MSFLPITDAAGILAILSGVCAFFYWLEKTTQWRLFHFLPPLVFVYVVPAILTNLHVIPARSSVRDGFETLVLPMMLVLLLLELDVVAAVRLMGRGVVVMLFGTLGVVVGAPIGYALVKDWLDPQAWKAFGALSGSWVGGSANLAAVAEMIEAPDAERALAVLGDTTMYLIWLPILMASKAFAEPFARFTGVSAERTAEMEAALAEWPRAQRLPNFRDYLYLIAIAMTATSIANATAAPLAGVTPYLSAGTWRILLVTTMGIALTLTPMRHIPGSRDLGTALVLLFMAQMGATADLSGMASQALPFLLGVTVWIFIHGAFCLLGAKVMRTDVHTAAIASGANIGGVATASQVAAYHKQTLVPAGILMALIGYALGNYAGLLAAALCQWVSGESPIPLTP